jgi:HNH endonuclease
VTKLKRKYSQPTLKRLFGLAGNQCSHPNCTEPVILLATEQSDAKVLNQICHIYALSEDGPRGKLGLTETELNEPENLLLLCPTHHTIIDVQHETYPAGLLQQWKKAHEFEIQKRLALDLKSIDTDVITRPSYPTELVDKKIEDEIILLRKSRFFMEFDRVQFSLVLAKKLVEGEYFGGSGSVRSCALTWCARILSVSNELEKAEDYLKVAKYLGTSPETEIANAFIFSMKGDKSTAMSTLAKIDSPMSWTASLMIVSKHDGPQGAINWLKAAEIESTSLDSDGKYFLLSCQLELADYVDALKCIDLLTDNDLRDAPVLHHMTAITHLLTTVPDELRESVFNLPPIDAESFPLSSGVAAIKSRRIARLCFIKASEVEESMNYTRAAAIDDEYALWLELKDPEYADEGKIRLESKLRDPKSALRFVHLGIQFRIKMDLKAVEREIDRQIAFNGGITPDAAMAHTQKNPEDVANYITLHFDELSVHINKKAMRFIQIEMFSRAGFLEKAKECLQILAKEGLSETEQSRLERIIAEAEGSDPVELRKEQFKKTDSLSDLENLVDELENRGEWDALCEYGETLFGRTYSLRDAERLASALSNTHKNEQVIEFLKSNTVLLEQSNYLHMIFCWSLYNEGALLEARSELAKISNNHDDPNYRALQVNLGVSIGDWNSLSLFITNEYSKKDERNAQELLGAAQLAVNLGLPNAKELIFAAADKAHGDAAALVAAYSLATHAGLEDDAEVFQWMNEAAELSDDNGPVQKMSLKDILERKPAWDQRESEIWKKLRNGDIPMFLAAHSLNKSLIDLMLFPSWANLSENDPRRRGIVPAYSGKRQTTKFNLGGTVGLDATALLTLSFLNLLDEALDAFETVYIPHSTLRWLFEEKQNAAFHQPSRIRTAHKIHHLLATGVLEELKPISVPSSDLSEQIGNDLAQLIAEAEKVRDDDNTQRIVVRSCPVRRVNSLMEEEADLTEHEAILSSCQSIVNKLRQKGQITGQEESKARAYLQLQEKPWINQPEITDGAILYLDNVSVTYLDHIGVLEKLKVAGLRAIVTSKDVNETNQLISYETISDKINDAIERIRIALNSRIESGKIKLGRRTSTDKVDDNPANEHPTLGVIELVRYCDAIIVDDRTLNQLFNIDHNNVLVPILSTLDLLDSLASSRSISSENRMEYMTLLRRAGYVFIPINGDELIEHLNASSIDGGEVSETAELKAIRENILHIRMSNWLQIPKEAPWLDALLKTFVQAMKSLWRVDSGSDFVNIQIRSNWILNQIDIRSWAHCLIRENANHIVNNGRAAHIMMMLKPPDDVSLEVKDEYLSWVEKMVLAPIKKQYFELYLLIVEYHRKQIAEVSDMDITEGIDT